jgi:hypothetical protein
VWGAPQAAASAGSLAARAARAARTSGGQAGHSASCAAAGSWSVAGVRRGGGDQLPGWLERAAGEGFVSCRRGWRCVRCTACLPACPPACLPACPPACLPARPPAFRWGAQDMPYDMPYEGEGAEAAAPLEGAAPACCGPMATGHAEGVAAMLCRLGLDLTAAAAAAAWARRASCSVPGPGWACLGLGLTAGHQQRPSCWRWWRWRG